MTGISTYGQALNRISFIQDQTTLLNSLTNQLATGKKTQVFSGLGTDIIESKEARADLKAIESYQDNILRADRRMQLMLNSIEEFQAQAQILWDLMIGFGQESLHDDNGDRIYSEQTVSGTQDLSVFGSIPALVAANAPELSDPADSFEITFADPDDPDNSTTVTIDISDAAASAGAGDAQVELVNYINAQILAAGVPADLNAIAAAPGTGEIELRATAEIIISTGSGSDSISAAGLAALGLSAQTYLLPPENEIGLSTGDLDIEFSTLQDTADELSAFLEDLVNVTDDGRFLFGGADTLNQPLTNNGTLDSKITSLLTDWKDGTITSSANFNSAYQARTFAEDSNAITDTSIGYSAALTAGNAGDVFVRVSESAEVNYTVLANDQAFRDVLVVTSIIKNSEFAPIADFYEEPYSPGDLPVTEGAPGADLGEQKDNFYEVFNALTTSLNAAIDDLDRVRFQVESDRAIIDEIQKNYFAQDAILKETVSSVEDVDLNEVAVNIQTLQIQLEASYTVTGQVAQLSLVNFI